MVKDRPLHEPQISNSPIPRRLIHSWQFQSPIGRVWGTPLSSTRWPGKIPSNPKAEGGLKWTNGITSVENLSCGSSAERRSVTA
jgi:hypothetical protein